MYSLPGRKIWVAGHNGMVGSALARRLASEKCELVTVSRSELNLLDQRHVESWVQSTQPDCIIIAAAHVGGIHANASLPVEFLQDNLLIQTNIMRAAFVAGVQRLLFLGSSCIYPKYAEQPIHERELLSGSLEPTNQWYAIAKIAGIKLCEAYRQQYGLDWISAMPTNLYGPGDNYDLQTSHVLPALVRKIHDAKTNNADAVEVWGTGKPLREFMHSDDLADALIYILQHYSSPEHINIGSGEEVSISTLADLICDAFDFNGLVNFDHTMPDGTPRKLMDSTKLRDLGWANSRPLKQGILEICKDWSSANMENR
jgi:GDP-L-fucose synthase